MNKPHGGKLIDKTVKKGKRPGIEKTDLVLQVDEDTAKDIRNIALGLYSPLEGFMNKDDYLSVIEKMQLANGVVWTIPIILDVPESKTKKIKIGSEVRLENSDMGLKAVLVVEDIYKHEPEKFSENVFGTTDRKHPGVALAYSREKTLLGGDIYLIEEGTNSFPEYNLPPAKTRKKFEEFGWKTIVGFQTRNPAHIAHEFIQKMALEFVDGLFVNPIIGKKKQGDFRDEIILDVYTQLVKNFYPKNSSFISIFPSRMHYAGPREAVFHAIIRKNFGCTHFLVGRDHAGVGDYYDKFAAHEIFEKIDDIGIEIMKVSAAFFCHRCKIFTTSKICPHNEIYRVSPSGTEVREAIIEKDYNKLKNVMRDEVLDIIFSHEKPFVE